MSENCNKYQIPPKMKRDIKNFLDYIIFEKGLSENTLEAYTHNLNAYSQFLLENDIL